MWELHLLGKHKFATPTKLHCGGSGAVVCLLILGCIYDHLLYEMIIQQAIFMY